MFVHLVNDKEFDALGASSKMNNNRAFLGHLRNVVGSLPNTGSRQIVALSASAQPSTCRGSFLCKMGYPRIRSEYDSVFKPWIKLSAARFEPRLSCCC
jgi:hypothetical protein